MVFFSVHVFIATYIQNNTLQENHPVVPNIYCKTISDFQQQVTNLALLESQIQAIYNGCDTMFSIKTGYDEVIYYSYSFVEGRYYEEIQIIRYDRDHLQFARMKSPFQKEWRPIKIGDKVLTMQTDIKPKEFIQKLNAFQLNGFHQRGYSFSYFIPSIEFPNKIPSTISYIATRNDHQEYQSIYISLGPQRIFFNRTDTTFPSTTLKELEKLITNL